MSAPGFHHRCGLRRSEGVRSRQQIQVVSSLHQIDFQVVTHAGLFESLSKRAVDQSHRRKVLNAGEAQRLQFAQKAIADHERIGAADSRQDRRVSHRGQHLERHLFDDLIRIAVRHHPGQRPAPRHAKPARVVDHDQIDPARLLAFRTDARTGSATNDRLAGRDLLTKTSKDRTA